MRAVIEIKVTLPIGSKHQTAERRLGEMMEAGKEERASVGRRWDNGSAADPLSKPTLADVGIVRANERHG